MYTHTHTVDASSTPFAFFVAFGIEKSSSPRGCFTSKYFFPLSILKFIFLERSSLPYRHCWEKSKRP